MVSHKLITVSSVLFSNVHEEKCVLNLRDMGVIIEVEITKKHDWFFEWEFCKFPFKTRLLENPITYH